MGYLITQILIYLLLAAIIGFLAAWVLRGSRLGERIETLENELWALRNESAGDGGAGDPRVRSLEAELAQAKAECAECQRELAAALRAAPPAGAAASAPEAKPKRKSEPKARPKPTPKTESEPAAPASPEPVALAAPDDGGDDLKRISGIGPKIEGILHELGVYYFRQIADWTPENVDWVNEKLRFKGRIEREKWIEQAKTMEPTIRH